MFVILGLMPPTASIGSNMPQPVRSCSSLTQLRTLGMSLEIDEATARRIQGQLLVTDGSLRQGLYGNAISEFEHLHAAYDAIAEEIVHGETPDSVLENMIPVVVHGFGLQQKWLPVMGFETLLLVMEGSVSKWRGKRLLMRPRLKLKPPRGNSVQTRERRLQKFIRKHDCSISAVRSAARVHKPQMQQWRNGKLSDQSVISERIEAVLRGKTPISSTASVG